LLNHKLKSGDLVTVEPWDCEGVEPPWGWDHEMYGNIKSKQVRRTQRVKIVPGSTGFVVSFDHHGVEDYDVHYVVIVGDRKLGVPYRFLHKVET
jgi:hypothetical protein